MPFSNPPCKFFDALGYKFYSSNSRDPFLPNLWCLCKVTIDPTILIVIDQLVSFKFKHHSSWFCSAVVYASTNISVRRSLWADMSKLINDHPLLGSLWDFNAILGSHEHRGRISPSRRSMEDFVNWKDQNFLLDLDSAIAFFTWSNGRLATALVERKLNRVFCNPLWLSFCSRWTVSSLPRLHYDHFPILFTFCLDSVTSRSPFKFHRMWTHMDS